MFKVKDSGNAQEIQAMTNAKYKLRQLAKINDARTQSRTRSTGPRFAPAAWIGIATWITITALIKLALNFSFFDLGVMLSTSLRTGIYCAPYCLGILSFTWLIFNSRRPKTWHAFIDAMLNEYEPVDKESYRQLQRLTREGGYLDDSQLRDWIMSERRAIELARSFKTELIPTFLTKNV